VTKIAGTPEEAPTMGPHRGGLTTMLDIQRRLTPSFYGMMALPSTAMGFALSVQIAALSWILAERYGLSIKEIGLVWAAGPISGILGQVIIGLISDKVWFWGGRRRPFIIIGGVLTAMSLLALPNIGLISQTLGFATILGVAVTVALVLDLSINVSFNPTRSLISDLTPEGEPRTRGYTWMQTISGSFGVLAYALGALIGRDFLIYFGAFLVLAFTVLPALGMEEPRALPITEGADSKGFGLSKLITGTLPLWGLFLFSLWEIALALAGVTPEPVTFGDVTLVGPVSLFLLSLTIPLMAYVLFFKKAKPAAGRSDLTEFQKIMAAHSFSWIGIQAVFVYLYPLLAEATPDADGTTIGARVSIAFLVFNAVAALLPAFVLKPLSKAMARVRLHAGCLAIMALAYGMMFVFSKGGLMAENPLLLYILIGVAGIGWAAVVSLPFAIMSQRIDPNRMGLFMGTFNLSVVLPQLVASFAIGQHLNATGDKSDLFLIAFVSVLLSAMAWLTVKPLPASQRL
jgi:maltose/moltooligosaccharide transporter